MGFVVVSTNMRVVFARWQQVYICMLKLGGRGASRVIDDWRIKLDGVFMDCVELQLVVGKRQT